MEFYFFFKELYDRLKIAKSVNFPVKKRKLTLKQNDKRDKVIVCLLPLGGITVH